ncbi:unnamed protein product [Adineta ricciae]|uniref:B box-type domain-containing protein n=1 Tax=Adineta ricciae TaxID=249248 RepID=A0A815P7J7_ADIRI|nr:unnamed protein product [Adineta ricciae]
MARATTTTCFTCRRSNAAYLCVNCSQYFCFAHLEEHRQLIEDQFNSIEDHRNSLLQTLNEQKSNVSKHPLIQQINKWECDSIHRIQQVAEESRQSLVQPIERHIHKVLVKLNELSEQLKQTRREKDINETILQKYEDALKQLTKELNKLRNISIREEISSFITKISVVTLSPQLSIPTVPNDAKWMQKGITLVGGNESGNQLQLYHPNGLYVDDNGETLYIADCFNHRVVKWQHDMVCGQVIAGGNGQGNENNQLSYPRSIVFEKETDSLIICDAGNRRIMRWPRRSDANGEILISDIDCWDLIIDNDGYLYASDVKKNEVKRWKIGDINETLVIGGNGRGKALNQLHFPTYIYVDQDYSIYVSDSENHRIMKWIKGAKEGLVVAGGNGRGNGLNQLSFPRGILVNQLGTVYVADTFNHRVMRWTKGASQGDVIVGGKGNGTQAHQLNLPVGLSFDHQNNLYVVDNHNHRIQKYNIE